MARICCRPQIWNTRKRYICSSSETATRKSHERRKLKLKNLISGFKKCGIYPCNPNNVYIKLSCENVNLVSLRKALDQSLMETLSTLCRRDQEELKPNKIHFDVKQGKSISGDVWQKNQKQSRI